MYTLKDNSSTHSTAIYNVLRNQHEVAFFSAVGENSAQRTSESWW